MHIPIHKLVLRKLPRGTVGATTYATRLIELDPRSRIPLAQVYFHELIHLAHRGWSETRVLREERRRWRRLSFREKAKLYQLLAKGEVR